MQVCVRQARRRLVAVLLFPLLTVPLGCALMGLSAQTMWGTWGKCKAPYQIWTVGLLIVQTCAVPMLAIHAALSLWIVGGMVLLWKVSETSCPDVHVLLEQALYIECANLTLILLAMLSLCYFWPALHRIRELSGRGGGLPAEFVERIQSVTQVNPEEECVVCLSHSFVDEGGNVPPWRQLPCGHRFHEPCVFRWLQGSQRCPVCRNNVNEAFADEVDGLPSEP